MYGICARTNPSKKNWLKPFSHKCAGFQFPSTRIGSLPLRDSMACSGSRDEFYQSDDFCPIPEYVFRGMALANLVLIISASVTTGKEISRSWRRDKTHSHRLWACTFTFLGLVLFASLPASRLVHSDHDHGTATSLVASIG